MRRASLPAAVAALVLGAAVPAVHADWSLGSERWNYDIQGFVNDQGERLDFEDDLNVRAERETRLGLTLGGFSGYWPDWSFAHTRLGGAGYRETEEVTFLGLIVVQPAMQISTRARLDDTEVTAHWPLRRGAWQFAPGVTLRRVEGEVLIREASSGEESRQPYDEVFPQLHLGLRWQPFTRLALNSSFQGISYQDSVAREWRAVAELRALGRLHLRAGWQEKHYDIRLSDYRLDARLDGPVIGVLLRF